MTESAYLRGLKAAEKNAAVSVRIMEHPRSPNQVVDYTAGLMKRACDEYDQAWCVLDVDDFPDVGEAVRRGKAQDIDVVVSNPCFELWLLLHFADHRAYTGSYDHVLPQLRKHVSDYDKARLDFRCYRDGWQEAVRRARSLAPEGKEHEVNPATGMWRLAVAIGRPARRDRS